MKKIYSDKHRGQSTKSKNITYNRPESIDEMNSRLDKISRYYEKMRIDEYIELLNKPKRLLWLNFISGLSKGLGTAIGFTLLGAIGIYILKESVRLNLPLIGKYIAEIVRIVEHSK